MGNVYSPKFKDNDDGDGDVAGLTATVRETTRPDDEATLRRLILIRDPGNSAAVFQQLLDARENTTPHAKPHFDPGMKI